MNQNKKQTNNQGDQSGFKSSGSRTTVLDIPERIKKQYPDLEELVIKTPSMNDKEREYWINIMPIMTDEQVKRLHDILINEKEKLKNIDDKYVNKLQNIVDKNKLIKEEEKRKNMISKMRKMEREDKEEEEQYAEDLLNDI